jgi:hypothetical protein
VCVVGNEDGAHKVSADLFQGLNDVGFSLAPNSVTYWVGKAMQGTDYQDLDETPEEVAAATKALASNTAHLARALTSAPTRRASPCPSRALVQPSRCTGAVPLRKNPAGCRE